MRPPAVSHNLKNCVKRHNENYWVFFQNFTEQYISYTMIQHQQIQILIDVFLVVVVFFLFFCSDIHRHDIDFLFFTILAESAVEVCIYFLDIIFFKTFFLFFFLKLLIFQASFFKIRNKKNKKTSMTLHICFIQFIMISCVCLCMYGQEYNAQCLI